VFSQQSRSSRLSSRGAGDPVSTGLVVSFAQAGGNGTGLSLQQSDLASKRLELLRDVVPALRRLAILANAGNPITLLDMRDVEAAAGTPGLTVVTVEIRRKEDNALKPRTTKGDLVTG
jgi:putative tryptophan/tyrosine transport system substrate-binding protein